MPGVIGRVIFILIFLAPMILLQGMPQLTPEWLHDEVAGVPVIVIAAALWFAIFIAAAWVPARGGADRSEEHTSELQSLMRISYAVFCLKKKKNENNKTSNNIIIQ